MCICVLLSSLSLDIFKAWAGDARNLVVMPGYCVEGTVGHQLLAGRARIEIERQVAPCCFDWFLARACVRAPPPHRTLRAYRS